MTKQKQATIIMNDNSSKVIIVNKGRRRERHPTQASRKRLSRLTHRAWIHAPWSPGWWASHLDL